MFIVWICNQVFKTSHNCSLSCLDWISNYLVSKCGSYRFWHNLLLSFCAFYLFTVTLSTFLVNMLSRTLGSLVRQAPRVALMRGYAAAAQEAVKTSEDLRLTLASPTKVCFEQKLRLSNLFHST